MKIERDDLRNQRNHYSSLFDRHNGDSEAVASTSGAEVSDQLARSRQPKTAPSIGPNQSVHLADFPSVAGSTRSVSLVPQQQGTSLVTRSRQNILLKTCHKLLILLALALALSTTLSIIYSKKRSDLGGGFALGTFMLAIVAILGSAFGAYHYPHCECWK